jgi:hypothetical protein
MQGMGFGMTDPGDMDYKDCKECNAKDSWVNMGWCYHASRHLGALTHELGHALGMYHEHQRPDATKEHEFGEQLYGPYIKILWENIKDNEKAQYEAAADAYVGSDGHGYADYDFDSIMHYGSKHAGKTRILPEDAYSGKEFGSTKTPSAGDINQILDMYQCIPKEKICQDFGLKATTGACRLDFGTCCATTPVNYKPGDTCSIYLGDSPGPLDIAEDHFNLLDGDKVTVAEKEYNHTHKVGPSGVVAPRGVIQWTAGSQYAAGRGFQMCLPKSCDPDGRCDHFVGVATCNFAFPTFCDGAFVQDDDDDLDWVRHRGRTSTGTISYHNTYHITNSGYTSHTGPESPADSDGYYVYVEATGASEGQKAKLKSQEFVLADGDARVLTFKTHMSGDEGEVGKLSVKLQYSGGEITLWHKNPTIDTLISNFGIVCEYNQTGPGACPTVGRWSDAGNCEVRGPQLCLKDYDWVLHCLPEKCKAKWDDDADLVGDPLKNEWKEYSVKPSDSGVIGKVTIVFEVERGRSEVSDIAIDAVSFADPNAPPTTLPPTIVVPATTSSTTLPCFTIDAKRTPTMTGQKKKKEVSSIACQTRCQDTEGCAYFTYYQSKNCYLHDDQATMKESHGTISGPPVCADSSNPLATVKKCFLSPDDDDGCLSNKLLWSYAKAGEKCHDKADSCHSKWFHKMRWSNDYQKRMHQCCPVTCNVCGCGLSDEDCTDCDDNSDMCLKAKAAKWKGYDCARAQKYCDHYKWGKHVVSCCPEVCKKTNDLSMHCAKNNDECLQKQRWWGGGYVCDEQKSTKYCKKGSTPWYHSMWGNNWRYDMITCCPKACDDAGQDIEKALCQHVAASDTCQLSY